MAPSARQQKVWKPVTNVGASAIVEAAACLVAVAPKSPSGGQGRKHSSAKMRADSDEVGDADSTRAGSSASARGEESDSERSDLSGAGDEETPVTPAATPATAAMTPAVHTRNALLQFRWSPAAEGLEKLQPPIEAARAAATTITKPRAIEAQSPPSSPACSLVASASPTSWAARRQQLKDDPKAETERRVKSLLNKLTMEKFEELYGQLVECGIKTTETVEVLAREVFKKATSQPQFTAMYADLCARLANDLGNQNSLGDALQSALLGHYTELLERPPPASADGSEDSEESSSQDSEEEASAYKKLLLGNVRFLGELVIRSAVPADELFACIKHLQASPEKPDLLEALAALLTVVGRAFDFANGPHFERLRVAFWDLRGLTFDTRVPKRVRCLLKDVQDLREAGWVDTKQATQGQSPKMLDEVRREAVLEARKPQKKRSPANAAGGSPVMLPACHQVLVPVIMAPWDMNAPPGVLYPANMAPCYGVMVPAQGASSAVSPTCAAAPETEKPPASTTSAQPPAPPTETKKKTGLRLVNKRVEKPAAAASE